jgi:hypothetical protein
MVKRTIYSQLWRHLRKVKFQFYLPDYGKVKYKRPPERSANLRIFSLGEHT